MTIPDDVDAKIARKRAQEHLLEPGYVKDIGVKDLKED